MQPSPIEFTKFYGAYLGELTQLKFFKHRRNKFERKLVDRAKQTGPALRPLVKLSSLSDLRFRNDYLRLNRPVIVKGLFDNWPATRQWNIEYLVETCGDLSVRYLKRFPKGKTGGVGTLRKVVEDFDTTPGLYLPFCKLFEHREELKKDICLSSIENLLGRKKRFWHNFFIGPKGAFIEPHCETVGNFTLQLQGKKRWRLYSFENTPYFYPISTVPPMNPYFETKATAFAHLSDQELEEKFPLFKNLEGYEFILDEGDVLYIPPLWWHTVTSLNHSLSFSTWFQTPRLSWQTSPVFTLLALRAQLLGLLRPERLDTVVGAF